MAKQLSVTVFKTDEYIRQVSNRPRRITPDGYIGIVLNGYVHEVFQTVERGLYVDLDDSSWEKDQCPLQTSTENSKWRVVEQDTSEFFNFEITRRGYYFAFNGSEQLLVHIKGQLSDSGYKGDIFSAAASFRPAQNGKFCDWYIGFKLGRDFEKLRALTVNCFNAERIKNEPSPNLLGQEVLDASNSKNGEVEKFTTMLAEKQDQLHALRADYHLLIGKEK